MTNRTQSEWRTGGGVKGNASSPEQHRPAETRLPYRSADSGLITTEEPYM